MKAVRILADDKPIEIVALLPDWVCDAVIKRYSGPFPGMGDDLAKMATATLLAGYPAAFKGDHAEKKAYMGTLAMLFAAYPEWAGRAVVDPVKGLPGRLKFLPSAAELKEALEAELSKARAYAVKAQWHKHESAKRTRQKDIDEQYNKLSAEDRAAIVAGKLARVKPIEEAPANHTAGNSEAA